MSALLGWARRRRVTAVQALRAMIQSSEQHSLADCVHPGRISGLSTATNAHAQATPTQPHGSAGGAPRHDSGVVTGPVAGDNSDGLVCHNSVLRGHRSKCWRHSIRQ